MKIPPALPSCAQRRLHSRALTLLEVLAVLAVFGALLLWLIPWLARSKARAETTSCNGNLKNVGLAHRIFATENGELYPFHISTNGLGTNTSGAPVVGTREFALEASQAWRHFVALSNELATPKTVHCPSDRERQRIISFAAFTNNQPLSYTLGLSASEDQPNSILATDRNLQRDAVVVSNEVWSFGPTVTAAFDGRIHKFAGNILLGDGSVQQVTSARLQDQFRDATKVNGTNQLLVVP